MRLIERVTSDEVIEAAYEWLCDRRQDYHVKSGEAPGQDLYRADIAGVRFLGISGKRRRGWEWRG
ncbi:hypothetical protein [Coleofasciculus sp.]|uniref:hypothetical protein n=1 Tax=Coleofasciculus sp. TaxID=3100458 RepID=UPI0039F9E5B8